MVKKRGLDRIISKSNPHHEKDSMPKLPPGIKVLIAYASTIAVFYLLYLLFGVSKPVSIFFGNFVYGNAATAIEFVSLFLLVSIIYGLVKRHYWAFWVSISWFLFGILNAIISIIKFRSEFDVLRNVLLISSFVVIILNGIISWYIYSEKEYFKVKHLNKETRAKDKLFVYIIITAIILSLLMLGTFGVLFYNTTFKITNQVISELKDSSMPELVCAQKSSSEQDICYLIVSIMNKGKEPGICENINSDFYKMTCYRSLE